jgi:hypothetical protein
VDSLVHGCTFFLFIYALADWWRPSSMAARFFYLFMHWLIGGDMCILFISFFSWERVFYYYYSTTAWVTHAGNGQGLL